MFVQIGNIKFEGLRGFDTWSNDGDSAVYAEHALVNSKPRLQKTGDELKDISLTGKFHAQFCNPRQEIEALQAAKSSGEIMPLLLGNGRYIADFVILSVNNTIDNAFPDGTPIQISFTLQLKEFVAYSKIDLAQQDARKKAFAVGDKNPVIRRTPQPLTNAGIASQSLTKAVQQTQKIDDLSRDFENNVSERSSIGKRIVSAADAAQKHIDDLNEKIDNSEDLFGKFDDLKSKANEVRSQAGNVAGLFPAPSVDDLKSANTGLQGLSRNMKSAGNGLQKKVTVRI